MGARHKVEEPRSLRPKATALRLNVRRDKKGEYFFVPQSKEDLTELVALDVQPEAGISSTDPRREKEGAFPGGA
jgi:hypothetical protein